MQRNLVDIIEGRQVFTPDEWPSIRRHLDALGVGAGASCAHGAEQPGRRLAASQRRRRGRAGSGAAGAGEG
jgi:hypothetical protein